jgi:hypothetical protein
MGSPPLQTRTVTVAAKIALMRSFTSSLLSVRSIIANTLPTLLRLSFVDHVPPLRLTWGAGNQKDFKVEESEELIGSHETVFPKA